MRRWTQIAAAVTIATLVGGCGDDGSPPGDGGGGDAGVSFGGPDIPWLDVGLPALMLGPCPMGWREATDEGGVRSCEPYGEGGALDCPVGEAHFPGESGCLPVGSGCPAAGDFAEGLPADRNVLYVRPGATGGDGSEANPYGSLMGFSLGSQPLGTVVALSRGMHEGPVRLGRDMVLRGACASDTTLEGGAPSSTEALVTVLDGSGELQDLSLADSPRPGVLLNGSSAAGRLEGVILRNMGAGALNVVNGSQLIASTVVVRDTQPRTDGRFGRGLTVEIGGAADVSRAVFEQNHDVSVYAGDAGSVCQLADAVVRDSLSERSDRTGGRGVNVQGGGAVVLSRVLIERSRDVGLSASQSGASLMVSDIIVRDTEARESDGTQGRGLNLQNGATGQVSRVVIERSRDLGVRISDSGTTASLSDLILRDTRSTAHDSGRGRGFNVQSGASAEVSRAVLERNLQAAVYATGSDTWLGLEDALIRDTSGRESDGAFGRGLNIELGASGELSRVVIERSRDLGVFAGGDATVVTATDMVVRDVASQTSDGLYGYGVASYVRSALRMTRFEVARAELCGIQLALAGEMDLEDGEVRGQPIGVCLRVDGYDIARLSNNVRYVDNGVNLQATTLPVPDVVDVVPTE